MEAVRQLEQIICKDVRTKSVQHLRNDLCKLTNSFGKIEFGGLAEQIVATGLWHVLRNAAAGVGYRALRKIERIRTYAFCKYGAVFPCSESILSHEKM